MTKKLFIESILVLLLIALMISPASGNTYYQPDGTRIDPVEFKKIVKARQAVVEEISRNGYGTISNEFEDPIRLRKRRIEQWEKWRKSHR